MVVLFFCLCFLQTFECDQMNKRYCNASPAIKSTIFSTQREIPLMFRCHTGFFYITNVLTCMSNSKCFLQPFTVDRGCLTVFNLNLHNCHHCMTCTTKELSSGGKESRMELALGQENCIEMVIGKKLEVPNPSYSRFSDFISGSDLSSTRVVSSCTDCIVVFAWLLNLEKCSVVGCEIGFPSIGGIYLNMESSLWKLLSTIFREADKPCTYDLCPISKGTLTAKSYLLRTFPEVLQYHLCQ